MKAFVIFLLALATVSLVVGADAPATIKEVLDQFGKWQIATAPKNADPTSFNPRVLFSTESAATFLGRIANGRSDADRRNAAAIAKINWKQLKATVLTPTNSIDAPKAKALSSVLEKIAASPSASSQDQAELKRLLD